MNNLIYDNANYSWGTTKEEYLAGEKSGVLMDLLNLKSLLNVWIKMSSRQLSV